MGVAERPPRVSSPGFVRSPANMGRGGLAHPLIERVAGRAAECVARAAQVKACGAGAVLPSSAAAPWANADGATVNRAPGALWSSLARSVLPGRTGAPPLICVIFS